MVVSRSSVQRRSANRAGSRRRLLLAVVTEALSQEEESTIGSGRDKASSIKLRSPTVVHLHPTRIAENRVPLAESAAGWHLPLSPSGVDSASWLKALFPSYSRPFAAKVPSDGLTS